ncbi:MAG TPA: ATP-binding cassette domain-containing protein [Steroidobacteraceae bacterium]|nr:ATP-binding cassette domain-containing protein [Steroidobacteraceae bacterium]
MIGAQALNKRFGDVVAVQEVSFAARDGAITGLVGPNGAGKSTTLRMLYTVLRPDAGTAVIDEIDVVKDPLAVRKRLGVLPHSSGVYPNLTARENVRYFGALHGLGGEALDRRVDELLGLLDLRTIADRRAKGFSQGEKVKVAIARALVHSPRNLILDEPTNGLDVMAIRTLRDVLRNLRDQGTCILFSSHVMQEVAALCDAAIVIGRGRVLAQGSPDDIKQATGTSSLEDAFVALLGRPADTT